MRGKLLNLITVLVTVMSIFSSMLITASAANYTAFKQISNSKPMKTYILSTSNIPCYTSSTLKTRGTVTAGKSSTAYIAPSDDVYIIFVDSKLNCAKVTYPVGKKRYTAYIALNKITSNNSTHKKTTAKAKVMTYKRTNSNSGSSSMYISKGESVYLIATSGSYYQVMYPCSGGWRLAWVTKTNYNKYLSNQTTTTNTTTVATNSSFSIKHNVVTLNGVKLYEYPLNTQYSKNNYANVNGKSVCMNGIQCIGYVRYIQTKLYGKHYYNSPRNFTNLSGSERVYITSESKLKSLINSAGVGAHIRTNNLPNKTYGHSMIIAEITDKGFTILNANGVDANGKYKYLNVGYHTYTWKEYLKSNYGKAGFRYIEVYKK